MSMMDACEEMSYQEGYNRALDDLLENLAKKADGHWLPFDCLQYPWDEIESVVNELKNELKQREAL